MEISESNLGKPRPTLVDKGLEASELRDVGSDICDVGDGFEEVGNNRQFVVIGAAVKAGDVNPIGKLCGEGQNRIVDDDEVFQTAVAENSQVFHEASGGSHTMASVQNIADEMAFGVNGVYDCGSVVRLTCGKDLSPSVRSQYDDFIEDFEHLEQIEGVGSDDEADLDFVSARLCHDDLAHLAPRDFRVRERLRSRQAQNQRFVDIEDQGLAVALPIEPSELDRV